MVGIITFEGGKGMCNSCCKTGSLSEAIAEPSVFLVVSQCGVKIRTWKISLRHQLDAGAMKMKYGKQQKKALDFSSALSKV
ncbi:hypothetical protein [Pontibacter sp. H249]|uniref:hypothetical protein n=1 Tax=Pontibacter sp. H249 TaxID=3133420 RepID=UPI0030BE9848